MQILYIITIIIYKYKIILLKLLKKDKKIKIIWL